MTSLARPDDELANAITHGVGFVISLMASVTLILEVANRAPRVIAACAVYAVALPLVYGCSTLSHLFYDVGRRKRYRTLDQASIFLLIAGTYTPFAVIYLNNGQWLWLFAVMWIMAGLGIWRVLCVRDLARLEKVLYGAMGFLPVMALWELSRRAPQSVVFWIVAGGVYYSLGAVFLRLSATIRYAHAVWHLFVIAGSASHYWAILLAVRDHKAPL